MTKKIIDIYTVLSYMLNLPFAYFDGPLDRWTICGYYQFRSQQTDFSGVFRKENSLLKKNLEAIVRNSDGGFSVRHIERAQGMLNTLKVGGLV